MEFESLKLSIDETVATIAFSRPEVMNAFNTQQIICLLYTSPSPRDATLSRMPSSA